MLTVLLFDETVWNSADNEDISYGYPDSISITLVRFLCGLSMHYLLQEEIEQGLSNMKFALNHMWKFDSWRWAWLIGFLQMIMVVFVEVVNIIVLCANNTVMDILMNFLALVVIRDLDDYFAQTITQDPNYKLIDSDDDGCLARALQIQTTTSYAARRQI